MVFEALVHGFWTSSLWVCDSTAHRDVRGAHHLSAARMQRERDNGVSSANVSSKGIYTPVTRFI